ncbi:malonate decarboxylase subunit epsilon [Dechloromonas sp. A34]|uniref:malonate decarboxylase subunit epsilon n=1 Tax=Dechloromonas sp. A34 TaxID=447588 RepID=UPI0022496D1F|nr:malonate decarboxylase subunit epsilon [Dechloromonas sp. A34]
MRLALLFSGQGGQGPAHWQQVRAGLGGPLREALLAALPDLAEEGAAPASEILARNAIAQPLIFAQQMLLWEQLREKLPRPICVAGYSLGEMAACCVAGVFPAASGLALTVERARLMDGAAPGEHGMLAVLGLDDPRVETLAAEAGLAVAIRNAPRHLVVAGPRAGIDAAAAAFAAAGASRLVHLAVRTPSHTPLLAKAAAAFGERLAALPDGRLPVPVLSAIDATPARSVAAAGAALARQICTRLDWAACQQAIVELQPDVVLEIGPGNALTRLFNEFAPEIPARAADDFRSVDGIVAWLQTDRR